MSRLLPCQKVKLSESAWQAEMGGWWLTLETQGNASLYARRRRNVERAFSAGYLLADVMEASVFPVTLVGFSQDRVEGLVAIPPGGPGVARNGKRCHVNLETGPQVINASLQPNH